jgi:hypothetical protein
MHGSATLCLSPLIAIDKRFNFNLLKLLEIFKILKELEVSRV